MAYKPLPMVEVGIDDLRLDLQNYRIPIAPNDEAAALNYLFASEDVLEQIKLFLRDGYFDNEVPIAVKENGAYVVLEGNRRVSALKAIASPAIVPDHQAQVEELRTRYATEVGNMPQKIRVLEVPSRAAARKQIARLHTGVSKKRWTRDQQANYYVSLLRPGVTASDLKALYPDVDIIRFLRMYAVRQFLSGAKFKDRGLRDYVKSADLAMSSFEYAYRNAAIAGAVGVRFNQDGKIEPARKKPKTVGATLPEREREALEYLVGEFRANRLNTRSPQFRSGSDEQAALLARLLGTTGGGTTGGGAVGGGTSGGSTGAGTSGGGTGADTSGGGTGAGTSGGGTGAGTGGGRGPNHPDTLKGLSIDGLPLNQIPSNLQKRVLELRAIDVGRTPAAAAMLLRSVLEATIKWHFAGSASPVSGMLSQVFPEVEKAYGKQRAVRDTINTMKSGSASKPGSINWFNAAAHNPDMEVKAAEVRSAYSLVQPVLIRLMRPA